MGQNSVRGANTNNSKFTAKVGQLENGFRYIIKPIEGDKGKILMNLIVNAGTNNEDSDQYQLAHLLEHMAYNGTEHFPSLRNDPQFFSQLNMEPRDMSAHSGGNITQYKFRYPQDVSKALDTALSIYHDVASGKVLFEKEAVQTERKALYQEYLYANTAKSYASYKVRNALTKCKDFIPFPKDYEDTLMNSSIDAMKRFYGDWYRPDLMTISIIGNIKDVDQVETKIRNKFKDLKAPDHLREKENCWQNYINSPKQFVIQRRAAAPSETLPSQTTFLFYFRNPRISFRTLSKPQSDMLWSILTTMISNRLKDQQLQYNVRYTTGFHPGYGVPAVKLKISVPDDAENVIKKVFKSLAGISTFGFRTEEWQSIRNQNIKNIQDRDYSSPDLWSDIILNAITNGDALPNPTNNSEIGCLKNLNVGDLNTLLKREVVWKPDDIAIIVPHEADKDQFPKKRIRDWINKGLKHPANYRPSKMPEQLLSEKKVVELQEGKIVNQRFGDYNEDVIELKNGVKIVLKAIDPKSGRSKNKIIVHGFSPHGAACFGRHDIDALFAPKIIQNSGVGEYNKFEINKLLSTTSIPFGVRDYIEQKETGVKAEVVPEDLEILLQLIYLSFTKPRYDKNAFEDWKIQELQKSLRNDRPNNTFINLLDRALGVVKLPAGGDRYQQSLKVIHKKALHEYKSLHSKAKDFTFMVTGDFTKNKVLPLLQKYLGNLPNTKNDHSCRRDLKSDSLKLKMEARNLKFDLPENVKNDFLVIGYTTPLNIDPGFKDEIRLKFIKQALNLKLKGLRYEKNLGVYFSVASERIDHNNKTKTIQIYLRCSREDFDKVQEACNGFFDELKTDLVPDNFLNTLKKSSYLPKWQETLSDQNKSVMQVLYDFYRFDIPITEKERAKQFIEKFDAKDLLSTANKYLDNESKWTFIGSPRKKKEGLN